MSVAPSRSVRKTLEWYGMLTPSGFGYPRLYKAYTGCCLFAIVYTFVGSLADFYLKESAVTEKLQAIQISMTILNGLLKFLNTCYREKKLDAMLKGYDDLWDKLYQQGDNREIMEKSGRWCRTLYKFLTFIIIFAPTMNWTVAISFYLILGVDDLAFPIIMPYNGKRFFIITQTVQIFLIMPPSLAHSSSFLLYLSLSEQLAASMRVVCRKLREERISNETIRAHQDIIKLVNEVNDVFSWLFFFETCTVSLECSCSAYAMFRDHIKEGRRNTMFSSLTNFVVTFFIPYIICYCGDKVTTESHLLFRDAYNGVWYEHDLQAKKHLRMVMLGASKPLNFHYRHITIIGMELFKAIINMTYTFLNAILWLE